MIRLEIKKKVQYDINRETANTPAWSPGKIDKYDYVTGDEILPSDQSRFTVFSSMKSFWKPKKKRLKMWLKKSNWRCGWKTNKGFTNFKRRPTGG